ncbi:MAG TPA: L,D-transpeptidase family protein [Caulobacteraceae bacterium]
MHRFPGERHAHGEGAPQMIFTAYADGRFDLAGQTVRCAVGAAGVVAASDKREGDGASPAGVWPLRELFYRPDRGPAPPTALPAYALAHDQGWCDDPGDEGYNRKVALPYPARCESLWREDGLYDLIVLLGYNDRPVVKGAGSAIFLHIAQDDFAPTQGCVALSREAMHRLLAIAALGDALAISLAGAYP